MTRVQRTEPSTRRPIGKPRPLTETQLRKRLEAIRDEFAGGRGVSADRRPNPTAPAAVAALLPKWRRPPIPDLLKAVNEASAKAFAL